MIVVTSLSPNHANASLQKECLNSWQKCGDVYSLNSEIEIALMKDEGYERIKFIKTEKTMEAYFGRPFVNINALLDLGRLWGEDVLIINSDILLAELPPLNSDGITVFSRYDYADNFVQCNKFMAGFDAFYIPNKFLNIFPPSVYAIGVCFWDYWLPLRAIEKNVPLYYPNGKFAYHKIHKTQYSYQEWLYIAEYFRLDFKIPKQFSAPQIATQWLVKIKAVFI